MVELSKALQSVDQTPEQYVPILECPDTVKANEFFTVKAKLGSALAHPDITEQHITQWVQICFQPDGLKAPFQIGTFEFTEHGKPVEGPHKGSMDTRHVVAVSIKTDKPGILMAVYCNIYGVWQSSKAISIERSRRGQTETRRNGVRRNAPKRGHPL